MTFACCEDPNDQIRGEDEIIIVDLGSADLHKCEDEHSKVS